MGLFAVVYGLSNAELTSWTNPLTVGSLLAGAALLLLFVWIESRVSNPLLPLRLLADRNRGASLVSIIITATGMFGVFLFLTYYFQQNLGYTPLDSGVAFLPMTVIIVTASIASQTLLRPRFGSRILVTLGMGLAAIAMLLLTRLGVHATYAAEILPSLLVMGIGLGLIFSSAINNATAGVEPRDAGVASASVNAMQQIGGAIGTAVLSSIYATAASRDLATAHNVATATVYGYTVAFAVSAGIFFVGMVIAATLFEPRNARVAGAGAAATAAA